MPIFFMLALVLAATPASSAERGVTAGPFPACTSEPKFREAVQALKMNDEGRFNAIGGCVITRPGLNLNVLQRGKSVSKVELFSPAGKGLTVWTDNRNIARP